VYNLQIETGEAPQRLNAGFLLPAAIVVLLDWVSKQLLWHIGKNFDIIDGILRITLVKNTGAAFGMFQGQRVFFIAASIIACIILSWLGLHMTASEGKRRLALSLILGGALGNLIDRIYPGEVIDFIDMGIGTYRWYVYNVADIGVTAGVVLLLLTYLSVRKRENGG
jgi:signal peptidase II